MIITRSPLRISLGGGGTDLPSYYRQFGGFLISAAINKYVYVTVLRPFRDGIYLKYSKLEHVDRVVDVAHPIIREVLHHIELKTPQIEITTLADIPSGTGLGSSGSFTTALLKAVYAHRRRQIDQTKLAQLACHIEIDKLGEPIGKQDQYIAALGGLNCFTFSSDDSVKVESLDIDFRTRQSLEENLLLFFTGYSRSASEVLRDQNSRTVANDTEMIENLHHVKELGFRSRNALLSGNIDLFGQIMHEHWEHKKNRSQGMTNQKIDEWYDFALRNGAIGGKVVGAGGGGFLMFLASDRSKLRAAMHRIGLEEVSFSFDYEGTKIVMSG